MAEEEKKVKKEEKVLVVSQLPTEQIRSVKDESGVEYTLVTTEEALSEILAVVRKLEKGLL